MAFWGIVLEPKRKYTQTVDNQFHVTMATLNLANCDSQEECSSVALSRDGSDFILCNLSKKHKIWNVPLDLTYDVGDEVDFHVIGNSSVHLTGYLIEDDEDLMKDLDSDDSVEEEDVEEEEKSGEQVALLKNTKKLLDMADKNAKRKAEGKVQNATKKAKVEAEDDDTDEDDSDFDMDDDSGEEEEGVEEEELEDDSDSDDDEEEEVKKPEVKPSAQPKGKQAAKQKQQDQNAKQAKEKGQNAQGQKPVNVSAKKKKNKNKNKANKAAANGTRQGEQKQANGPNKKSLDGGVLVEELCVGNGPPAKSGKMVTVYYVGRLKQNNKQFDATTSGSGFKFRLGRGEVIKGWDVGVAGMKVGGKRRITIPHKMAYGDRGAPPSIPPRSTLVFEVELRKVQ